MDHDSLAQFRREFEERARSADALARAKILETQQRDAARLARAEEAVRLVEAIGAALTRPPLRYVRFTVLHRPGGQQGNSQNASWAGELEWTGAGARRSLRIEISQKDGMFRWYWSAGADLQAEQTVDIEHMSTELIMDVVAAITDGETFDAGQVPLAPALSTIGSG